MKIVMSRKHTVYSMLVRFGTWSPWSHSGVAFVDSDGVEKLIESHAGAGGVRVIPLADALKTYSKHEVIEVQVPDEAAGIAYGLSQVGKKYDWGWIWGYFVRERGWASDEKWVCSELTEAMIGAAGRLRFRLDATRITPHHNWMLY